MSETAAALAQLMSAISEEEWFAGWLNGLEYMLWDAVTGGAPLGTPEQLSKLKSLSGKCGGWIYWSDEQVPTVCRDGATRLLDRAETFIPIREWLVKYAAEKDRAGRP